MSYSLTAETRPGYLHVKVAGKSTRENVLRYLVEVNERCVQQKSHAVLIEENLRGPSLEHCRGVCDRRGAQPHGFSAAALDRLRRREPGAFEGTHAARRNGAVRRGVNVRVFLDDRRCRAMAA
jgi:hypothetical protein